MPERHNAFEIVHRKTPLPNHADLEGKNSRVGHNQIMLHDLRPLKALRLSGGSRWTSVALVLADERVGVFLLVQVAQCVVDTAVARLVGPDVEDEVLHASMALGHLPVLDSQVGNPEFGVGPLWQVTLLDLLDAHRVRVHGFFLKVPNKPMCNLGRDEIGYEERVEVNPLSGDEHQLHEET